MFDEYKMVGLFGNEYYVIADGKLSKILIDSDSRYTLRIGQTLQLADNYTIAPKQIDVDEGKVLVEIIKDGQFLEDVVIDVSPNNNTVYVYGQDIMGEEDVVTLMVNVDQVFQGQVDNLCIIEGIFQLSETGIEIQNDDRFGKLIVNEVTSDYITMENENSFSLPIDNTIHIAEDLYLRGNTNVGTGLGNDIFYLVKKYTDPGIYKVRGDAAEDVTEFTWNAINFPGFWYDIDSGTYSETMTITRNGLHSRYIGEGELIYNAEFKEDETNFDFNARSSYYPTVSSYHKIGLFGEQYFRIGQGKLSKILIDTDDAYVVKVGHDHELAEGYAFKPKEIDVTGEKVWVELTKDGQFIDDAIIDVASAEHTVFVYEQDIMGEEAVITLQINIHQLLKSQVDNFCIIEGIFQISDNVIDVGADDRFGNLIVHEVTSDYILMKNENSVNIPNDGTTHIAEGFYLRGNANVGLPIGPEIYYIFTEVTVEEIPVEPEEPADEPFVYSMSLQKGWNLVSIPIYPTESSTSSIFESYDDVIFPVYSWNAANKQYYEAESFEIGKGYWVMALNNTDVNIEGVPFTGQ
jgi:S-layer protein (TIGR01567 family)